MTIPLAYKSVAIAVMLAEANFCANRLQLPVKLPIESQDIQNAMVAPPRRHVFMGRIDADDYVFSFARTGRLRFIINLKYEQGDKPLRQYLEDLAKFPSKISANDAYRMATNWLSAIDLDMARLEKEHPSVVRQQSFRSWPEDGKASREILLPLFDVKWGDWNNPSVDIRLSGATGELISLRQEDFSYSKRPEVLINDMDVLWAIRDEDYAKSSPAERSNLLVRFAAVKYPFCKKSLVTNTNGFLK